MKKLYLVLCMVLCMLTFSACGNTKKDDTASKFEEDTLNEAYESVVNTLATEDFSYLTEDETQYDQFVESNSKELAQAVIDYMNTTDGSGEYQSFGDKTYSYKDGSATVESKVAYENNSYIIRMTFKSDYSITSFSTEVYRTFSGKMQYALMNTLLGMGTVFVVLIFISLIIGLLKFVPRLFEKKQASTDVKTDSSIQQIQEILDEEELVDDSELVAVITAAIYASLSEEEAADGLVVRSVRKVNKKWKNA